MELCKVALGAKKYDEAMRYCVLILEIDPENVDAWLERAELTYLLDLKSADRFNESMQYIKKAAEVAPNDERVEGKRRAALIVRTAMLNLQGESTIEDAINRYTYLNNGSGTGFGRAGFSRQAIWAAMGCFLEASDYAPDNPKYLQDVCSCYSRFNWIGWGPKVIEKVKAYESAMARKDAMEKLPKLKVELEKAAADWQQLRRRHGLLDGFKVADAEKRVQSLTREIAELEKIVSPRSKLQQ